MARKKPRADVAPVETIEPEVPAAVEPAGPPVLRLIARDVVLRRRPRTDPLKPYVRGDVAQLGDRLFARFDLPGHYGMVSAVVELPAGAEVTTDIDPAADRDWINGVRPADVAGQAVAKLSESPGDYFSLDPPEPRLFDAGRCFYPKEWLARRISLDVLRGLFALHVSGDWGEFGRHQHVELSPEERWMLPAFSVETQNREAVRTRETGMAVRSRYRLASEPAPVPRAGEAVHWPSSGVSHFIDIASAVGCSPITIMSLYAEPE